VAQRNSIYLNCATGPHMPYGLLSYASVTILLVTAEPMEIVFASFKPTNRPPQGESAE
jgi:hypothetical protein